MYNIKEKISLFFSRIWVFILRLSYPAQSSSIIEDDEEVVIKQFAKSRLPKGIVLGMLVFFVVVFVYLMFIKAPDNFPVNKIIEVKSNTLEKISIDLEKENVIKSATFFKLYIKLIGEERNIKQGDYMFKKTYNLFEIARRLYKGVYGLEPVRVYIPEGASVYQIADILENKLLRFDKEKFIKLAKKYEGKLFPDTYYFMPNVKEEKIIDTMTKNFYTKIDKLKPLLDSFMKKHKKTLDDVIIMASIVEKESWKYNDRRLIAGVLWTRLKIEMPLQVDATYVYTHNKGSSQITLSELKDKTNPYNTYVHKGLPPTPIGNPGFYAIKATITPIFTGNLYYLADKEGNTYFSKTYKEHMQKREKYINW